MERWKVTVMGCLAACELPYPFDRTELGAVGRKKLKRKVGHGLIPPVLVQAGMMKARVVQNDDDPATGMATGLAQFFLEAEEGLAVE